MSKVQKLPEQLANMIAAGEVVERPASAVKELIENSIDARATVIDIYLKEAGISEIKIIDNGVGMSREDAILSLERHATSKIKTLSDLFKIHTLGFRGEALPSIASVSEFTMITFDGQESTHISQTGGKDRVIKAGVKRQGTEIVIKKLFLNVPARLKYLKSKNQELTAIVEHIKRIALSNTKIRLRLYSDDKLLLNTTGTGDLKQTIFQIYGGEVAKNLIKVSDVTSDYSFHGFVTSAEINKSTSKFMNLFINGRTIQNFKLNKAILNAYGTLLPKGRYPHVFINIEMDSSLVDVNVHPAKMDVHFSNERTLLELLQSVVNKSIQKGQDFIKPQSTQGFSSVIITNDEIINDQYSPTPKTQTDTTVNTEYVSNSQSSGISEKSNKYNSKPPKETIDKLLNDYEKIAKTKELDDLESLESIDEVLKKEVEENVAADIDASVDNSEQDLYQKEQLSFSYEEGSNSNEDAELDNKSILNSLSYIGQFHGTYVLAQSSDTLYIIDQHAAAERVNYERLLNSFSKKTKAMQQLLIPIQIDFSISEILKVESVRHLIESYGISLEKFGSKSYIVRELPLLLIDGKEEENVRIVIEVLSENKHIPIGQLNNKLAADLSCKESIKANSYINNFEVEKLFKELSKCNNPYTCPHGRPTIIQMTNIEIERMFKRR